MTSAKKYRVLDWHICGGPILFWVGREGSLSMREMEFQLTFPVRTMMKGRGKGREERSRMLLI